MKYVLHKAVFCFTVVVDGTVRYQSELIKAALEYEPPSISSHTRARLVAAATIQINTVVAMPSDYKHLIPMHACSIMKCAISKVKCAVSFGLVGRLAVG